MGGLKPTSDWDVIIIGAGLAGSSLAAVLARQTWQVLLLERGRFPHHKVCGEFLSPEAQTTLRAMGLYHEVKALSPVPMRRGRLVSPQGLTVAVDLPGEAWGVSRFTLDATLAAAAERGGAVLQTGTTATVINPVNAGFEVTIRSKRETTVVKTRAVVVACGRYSWPGLPPNGTAKRSQPHIGLKCHYENVNIPAQVELFFFPGGYVGLNPIEGGRVNCCMLTSQAAFSQAGKSMPGMLALITRRHPALREYLAAGRVLPGTAVSVAPVDTYRPALPWDGVACLGDTAVMIPPLCGDGMAMAFRSAELCAPLAHDFLRGHLSLAAWEKAYQTVWHLEFDRPVRVGRYLQRILNLPGLSDALIGLGSFFPPLPKLLVRATRGMASQSQTP